jgi:ABC-2 type transport system permease protein
MAERQDQVQSLAFPLSIPIIFGYIMALTAVSSGSVSSFFRVLAYLPPTAPFAMPVLVGLGAVTWWQFLASAAISVVCTIAMARLAAGVYRRAILRTGGRVKIREILGRANAS